MLSAACNHRLAFYGYAVQLGVSAADACGQIQIAANYSIFEHSSGMRYNRVAAYRSADLLTGCREITAYNPIDQSDCFSACNFTLRLEASVFVSLDCIR
ncbi:hypothetical protein D3C75_527890 [compost metagenome]